MANEQNQNQVKKKPYEYYNKEDKTKSVKSGDKVIHYFENDFTQSKNGFIRKFDTLTYSPCYLALSPNARSIYDLMLRIQHEKMRDYINCITDDIKKYANVKNNVSIKLAIDELYQNGFIEILGKFDKKGNQLDPETANKCPKIPITYKLSDRWKEITTPYIRDKSVLNTKPKNKTSK